jgi:iron(III) transport system permease protein
MVLISGTVFLTQKYIVNKKSFVMNSLRPIQPKPLKGFAKVFVYLFVYGIALFAAMPMAFVVFASFRATRGPIFIEGFSLDSYRQIFRTLGVAIRNTYVYGLIAIVIIVMLALFISYLTVRRKGFLSNLLDSVAMLPFALSGSVVGIVLILAFNSQPLILIGTPAIIVLAYVVRRLPYTLRSSSAILHQISPSIEEAAISLGDSPMKSFFKVTAVMMMPGVVSGAVLSWITILNELNASILLFNVHTQTMPVVIYNVVHRGSGFGAASALASILIFSTVITLGLFFKITGRTDISL